MSIGLKGHIMEVDFPEEFGKWKLDELADLVQAPDREAAQGEGDHPRAPEPGEEGRRRLHRDRLRSRGRAHRLRRARVVLEVNPDVPIAARTVLRAHQGRGRERVRDPGIDLRRSRRGGATRQDIDLVWGAVLTRYLTLCLQQGAKRAVGRRVSAGRVQTPTLKLIVDREARARGVRARDYWVVKGAFEETARSSSRRTRPRASRPRTPRRRRWTRSKAPTRARLRTIKRTQAHAEAARAVQHDVAHGGGPSEGLTPAQTMRIAESLYMNGLISYPRVDNTVYPPSLDLKGAPRRRSTRCPRTTSTRAALLAKGRSRRRVARRRRPTTRRSIRPGAADPEKLKPEEWKLYNLVARRFMATLSDAAVLESTQARDRCRRRDVRRQGRCRGKAGFPRRLSVRHRRRKSICRRSTRATRSRSSAPRWRRSRRSRPRGTRRASSSRRWRSSGWAPRRPGTTSSRRSTTAST